MEPENTQDTLQIVSLQLTRMEEQQKKLRLWLILLCAVLAAALVGAAVFLVPRVLALDALADQASQQLGSIGQVVDTLDMENLRKAMDLLEKLDLDAMSASTDKLNRLMDTVNDLDVEALNRAIEGLNKALAPLLKLFS